MIGVMLGLSFFHHRDEENHHTTRHAGDSLGWSRRLLYTAKSAAVVALPWLSVVFLVLIVAVPAGLLIWFLFFTQSFAIQAVTVIDARPQTTAAVEDIVESELLKSSWYSNIFFTPVEVIEDHIASSLPQVRTAHINRKLPSTLVVVIQEKTPALLLLSGGKYYFVDTEGIAYEEAQLDTLPGTVLPTVKNNDRGARVTIDTRAVDASFVQLIQSTHNTLPEYTEAEVAEIRIPSLATREVYFLLTNNWEIRFDSTRPAEGQMKILKRIIEEIVTLEEKKTLEYIDLRIPDRIYYRTKEALAADTIGKKSQTAP